MRSPEDVLNIVMDSIANVASDLKWNTTGDALRDGVRAEIAKQLTNVSEKISAALREES